MERKRTLLAALLVATIGLWSTLQAAPPRGSAPEVAHASTLKPLVIEVTEGSAPRPPAKPLAGTVVGTEPALTVTEVLQESPTAKSGAVAVANPCATVPCAPCAVPASQPCKPVQPKAKAPCTPVSKIEKATIAPAGAYGVPGPLEDKCKPAPCGRRRTPGGDVPPCGRGGGAPVPEPAALMLFGLAGTAGMLAKRIRAKAKRMSA